MDATTRFVGSAPRSPDTTQVDLEKVEVVPRFEELNVGPRDFLYRVELDQITVYCLAHELE
jgi:hypothetical protein